MNTSSMRVYERLRKRSLRAKKGRVSRRTFIQDRRNGLGGSNGNGLWYSGHHQAYIRGVRDALEAVEAEEIKAYWAPSVSPS